MSGYTLDKSVYSVRMYVKSDLSTVVTVSKTDGSKMNGVNYEHVYKSSSSPGDNENGNDGNENGNGNGNGDNGNSGNGNGGYTGGDGTANPAAEDIYYTITFLDEDGKELKTESVKEGESATPPSEPTKYGYDFIGWDKGSDAWTDVHSDAIITARYAEDDETIETPPNEIPDEGTPLAKGKSFNELAREQNIPSIASVPFSAPRGEDGQPLAACAILNLIIIVIGAALALRFALVRKYRNIAQNIIWIVIAGALAAIGVALFFFTEDIYAPIVWTDKWTVVNTTILAAGIAAGSVGTRRAKSRATQNKKPKKTRQPID
jgi:hypothetical protein